MSGPKVHRIATVEEVLDYCRGLLAQLASWRGKVGSLVLLVRLRSQLCFSAGTRYVPWRPCKGRHTSTSRCRARSRSLPRTWTRESRRRPRKRRKSAPRAGASPAPQPHWLRHWPKAAPAFPQNCKLPCRPCAMVRPRRRRGGRAGALPGLALLAPAGEEAALGARQREIAQRLGEGEETRTLADWLQGQPPPDDARGQELDRHIAELEAREGETAARPYAERAQRLAAEASPGRRQLLADSLLIELAARATARREAERNLSTLNCLVAELGQLAGSAGKALIDRAQDAVRRQDGQAANELVAAVRAAIDCARSAAAADAQRKAVLEGLSALGYEVREGMETAWASNGNVVLRSAQRPDYGVKLSGGAEGRPLQVRAIGFGQPGTQRDVARDRDAEALWCSDFLHLEH